MFRVSDLICLDDVALDAAAAPAAARRLGKRFCGDCSGGAEVAGGVVGVEGARFRGFDGALVAALGVNILDGKAHWVWWGMRSWELLGDGVE